MKCVCELCLCICPPSEVHARVCTWEQFWFHITNPRRAPFQVGRRCILQSLTLLAALIRQTRRAPGNRFGACCHIHTERTKPPTPRIKPDEKLAFDIGYAKTTRTLFCWNLNDTRPHWYDFCPLLSADLSELVWEDSQLRLTCLGLFCSNAMHWMSYMWC